jgi:hypothetical protein
MITVDWRKFARVLAAAGAAWLLVAGPGSTPALASPLGPKLGDCVWEDLNHDGIQDPDEPAIPDVYLVLTRDCGGENDRFWARGKPTSAGDECPNYTFFPPDFDCKYTVTVDPCNFDPGVPCFPGIPGPAGTLVDFVETLPNQGDGCDDSDGGMAMTVLTEDMREDFCLDFGYFKDSPPYCGDGELNQPSEDCEVGVPCADPAWMCDEITCLCSPPEPLCGDGVVNQAWEQCEVGVPCAEPGYACDETACLCSPPSGGEGCTPGYWKQKHHFDSWVATGFDPDQTVLSVFGEVDPSVDGLALSDALRLRGGGLNALMRHAVAALLNGAHPDVSYAMSSAGVIASVQAAVRSGEIEAAKDGFEVANEEGCPLN